MQSVGSCNKDFDEKIKHETHQRSFCKHVKQAIMADDCPVEVEA